jgi:hypothetical protein
MSKVAAFAALRAKLVNDRWGWSGLTEDGRVVLQLWQDRLKGRPASYDTFNDPNRERWGKLPGNAARIEHLKIARDRWDGKFKVVVGIAKDIREIPRRTEEAFPSKIEMRLVEFNEETGEFRAEQVIDG